MSPRDIARAQAQHANGHFALPIPVIVEHFDDPRDIPVKVRKRTRLRERLPLRRMKDRD